MNRPKIKIKRDISDYCMEIIGALFLFLMIAYPAYHYSELPDTIPRHYNALGEPDGFSNKSVIWTLPIMGFFMYIGLFVLNHFPHIFNYPTEITEENAEKQYRMATKLLRMLNLVSVASFFYIGFGTIQTALNRQEGLGTLFLPIFFTAIFSTIVIYLYAALKKNRASDGHTTI